MVDLQKLHEMVWDWRRARGEADITPHDDPDNLRRAFCSCGVAMYWRVRKEPERIPEELANCAYWLLTAVGPDAEWPDLSGYRPATWELDDICGQMGRLLQDAILFDDWCQLPILLIGISTYAGLDLVAELAARLAAENAERER